MSLLQSEATKVRELLVGEINGIIDIAVEGNIHNTLSNDVRNWLKASTRHKLTRAEVFEFIEEKFMEAQHNGVDAYNLTFIINIWVHTDGLYIVPNTGNYTENWLDDNVDIELEKFCVPMADEEYGLQEAAYRVAKWKELVQIEPLQLHVCSVERFDEFKEDCAP